MCCSCLTAAIGLGDRRAASEEQFLGAIGAFGFVVTLGLFAYELHGIKKCHYLIRTGARLEDELGIAGQFVMRPEKVAGFINEPFAASVIYPGSLAAWTFLALVLTSRTWARVAAIAIFTLGFSISLLASRRIAENADEEIDEKFNALARSASTLQS